MGRFAVRVSKALEILGKIEKATSRLRILLRKTHNPEVAGSSPAAATKRVLKIVILSTFLNFLAQMIFAF